MAGAASMSATELTVRPLSPATWDAYAALIERHNGVWGGCWCTWFHTMRGEKTFDAGKNRELKHRLVEQDRAHASVVFDGDVAVGWCQYGSPAELPNIYHRKQYEAESTQVPDYRITCFFVDRKYRGRGVAELALRGAVEQVAALGGGVVEGYPRDTSDGAKVSGASLHAMTLATFERAGFSYVRPKGTKNCVVTMTVAPGHRFGDRG